MKFKLSTKPTYEGPRKCSDCHTLIAGENLIACSCGSQVCFDCWNNNGHYLHSGWDARPAEPKD